MSNLPPYAPLYSAGAPLPKIRLDEEIKLFSTTPQRERLESLAELFSIIVTLDYVERLHLRDSVSHSVYTSACQRLLAQYNTILQDPAVASEFVSLDAFRAKYNMSHTNAVNRLKVGVPATVEHAVSEPSTTSEPKPVGASARAVAEATGNLITCMDALKLKYKAKDQLHPLLSEVMTSIMKVTKSDFHARPRLVQWLITLNSMRATEELSDDQTRQLLFDLDSAYKEFVAGLD